MNSIITSAVLGVIMMFSGLFLKKNSSIAALAILAMHSSFEWSTGYQRVSFLSDRYAQYALF